MVRLWIALLRCSTRPTYSVKNQLKNPIPLLFFFSGSLGGGVVLSSLSLSSPLSSVGGGVVGAPPSVEHAAAVTHLSESLPAAES